MNWLIKFIIHSLSVFLAAYLLPGVHLTSFSTAIIVTIVMGLLNIFLKPLLLLLTIPLTILTLGLFALVVNALIVLICSALVDGFKVDGIISAMLFSLVVTILSTVLYGFGSKKED